MHDLTEVARVDIAPGVALTRRRVGQKCGEKIVFMRLEDVGNPQGIDIDAVAHGKGPSGLFVDDLGESIRVHRVDVIVLFEREAVKIPVALRKTYAVSGLTGRDNNLADTEFRRGLDHVVGADRVLAK